MGIIVYFIGNNLTSSVLLNLILSVCLGGLIYFALLFLFQEFDSREIAMLKEYLTNLVFRKL